MSYRTGPVPGDPGVTGPVAPVGYSGSSTAQNVFAIVQHAGGEWIDRPETVMVDNLTAFYGM